jgi:hypothetical protein
VRYIDPTGHLPGYESELHDGPDNDNDSNGGGDGTSIRAMNYAYSQINSVRNRIGNFLINFSANEIPIGPLSGEIFGCIDL